MNRVVRWLEPCSALGIGFVLNLAVSVAAWAGVISPRTVDPEWIAVAGAAGGLVSAMVHIGVVSLGPEPVERRDVVRAAIEGLFAVLVGGIVAAYLGPQAGRFFQDATPSDLRAVGFGIGMGAWRFAPGVFGALKLLSNPATLRDLALRWLTSMRPTP
ncbi:hypothetical protein KOAAANKH_00088 [Brevundimonas sp. NIBR10]|uniref:hypothetical protein n=1 Tax=Brevundimonas sp. NIBR10 TaxID=3015997 RepID=UPI0022F17AE4|nr:hypothetical protein [Brevundimonas sp. NIBR10]WGM45227.1 hypothetical protein KOAAANKH_00088 [Brevundimonas sp. NIBR10]